MISQFRLGTTHFGGYNHEAVVAGIRDCNYRLIDTAKRYGVEERLGQAIVVRSVLSYFFSASVVKIFSFIGIKCTEREDFYHFETVAY